MKINHNTLNNWEDELKFICGILEIKEYEELSRWVGLVIEDEVNKSKFIKIDNMELKYNEVEYKGEPMIKDINYWKKGMKIDCPNCGKKAKPDTDSKYYCKECGIVFIPRVKFNF